MIMQRLYEIVDLLTYQGPKLIRKRCKGKPEGDAKNMETDFKNSVNELDNAEEKLGVDNDAEAQVTWNH